MTKCPSCGYRLRLWNWRQNCPGCNVNLVYYRSNERLLDESEKAEIEHAAFQPKIDRGKAAFFGSPLAIVRIVLTFLPIAALFLPLAVISSADGKINVSAIEIYKLVSSAGTGFLMSGSVPGIAVILMLVSVVMIPVCLVCILASLGRHALIRNLILNSVMTLSPVVAAVLIRLPSCADSLNGILSTVPDSPQGITAITPGFGVFIYIALCLTLLVWNIYIRNRIKVEYKKCLIGGLESEEYFALVEQGLSKEEIRRKMLVALADLQMKAEIEREEEKRREEEIRRSRK